MSSNNPNKSYVLSLLGPLVHDALKAALLKIAELGEAGKKKVPANEMHLGKKTDPVLVADGESERAMCNVLDAFGKKYGVLFRVRGEEVGWLLVGDLLSETEYSAFMDGIDGTEVFVRELEFDSGPMLSICLGNDPKYEDVYASGVGLIDTGWLMVSDSYNQTVSVYPDYKGCNSQKLKSFYERSLPNWISTTMVLADDYAPAAKEVLRESNLQYIRTGSTACTIVLLALYGYLRPETEKPEMSRDYSALALDQMDKGEMEQPVLYHTMRLLGGVMLTSDGHPFDTMKINNSGSNANPPETVLFTLAQTRPQFDMLQKMLGL